ncbi:hypothetical protein CDAR_451221 [Caerostris darwini]|uniref:Uncharacterized protein n=1 Tax=Caerostris darwini TaxID=1538125 RepID=A0AAV4T2Y8_9ARAC|nr:hypothetical protein CDAR_451221 [Caerostris darwini]
MNTFIFLARKNVAKWSPNPRNFSRRRAINQAIVAIVATVPPLPFRYSEHSTEDQHCQKNLKLIILPCGIGILQNVSSPNDWPFRKAGQQHLVIWVGLVCHARFVIGYLPQ